MWSLAVEEQFYLFYPTLLFVLFRWRRYVGSMAIAVVSLIGTVSFLLNLYGIIYHPSFTFYSLPTRAWELMAGARLAISAVSINVGGSPKLLGWGGIGTITFASLVLTENTAFPGAWALLPVVGGVAFIAANTEHLTSAGKVFRGRPIVFVGLISYSLYLWHWPLLAFLRYFIKEPTRPMIALAVAATVVLATLSWWLVEQPIRKKRFLVGNRNLLVGSSAVWIAILLASLVVDRSHGLTRPVQCNASRIDRRCDLDRKRIRADDRPDRAGRSRQTWRARRPKSAGRLSAVG